MSDLSQAIECTTRQQLVADESGGLRSLRFDDIYYNPQQGAEESHHVFLDGNRLEQRWCQRIVPKREAAEISATKDYFVIAETGFGSGLNFLASWALWNRNQHPMARYKTLYFYSCERYPLTRAALEKALALYNPYTELSAQLLQQYPDPLAGDYLLSFRGKAGSEIKLVLLFGDSVDALQRLEYYPANNQQSARGLDVDAWFLDGFAPAKNPAMWNSALFRQIARHSYSESTAATFSVARSVREQFQQIGFEYEKRPGFGRKRDMLIARSGKTPTPPPAETHRPPHTLSPCYYRYNDHYSHRNKKENAQENIRRAVVIGAGIAGCCSAYQLARRGWQVELIDSGSQLASAASGNRRAILYARSAKQRSALSEFHEASFHYASHFYRRLGEETDTETLTSGLTGMLKLGEQLEKSYSSDNPELQSRRNISAEEASALAGIALEEKAIYYPEAGWLDPQSLCRQLTQSKNIRFRDNTTVQQLQQHDGRWRCISGQQRFDSDVVVIACGHLAAEFCHSQWLPIKSIRGQTSELPRREGQQNLQRTLCRGGYITPAADGTYHLGASFTLDEQRSIVLSEDHRHNLQQLAQTLPVASDWRKEIEALLSDENQLASLSGRVGFRCASPDYLPIVGPLPDRDRFREQFLSLQKNAKKTPPCNAEVSAGLFVSTAYGSHGFTTAPLASELLSSQIEGAPIPLGDTLRQAISPARFLLRQLIKGR